RGLTGRGRVVVPPGVAPTPYLGGTQGGGMSAQGVYVGRGRPPDLSGMDMAYGEEIRGEVLLS
ncbi:MAG: hypothetical protein CSA97_01445, partial [Bacteroidetes bacterium]